LKAKEGSYWPAKTPLMAYGLEDLPAARQAGYLNLVEGESDRWTLKYHELPVLGIPGAEAAQTLQPEHLQGLTKLYLSREPGQGGEAFVAGLRRRLRAIGWRGQALVFSSDRAKDPNELHKRNP
jgi:hypothetical protein